MWELQLICANWRCTQTSAWRFNVVYSIEWPGKLDASLKWLTLTTRAYVAFLYIEWKSNRWHTWNITTVQCVYGQFSVCAPWKMPFTSAGNEIAPENGKTASLFHNFKHLNENAKISAHFSVGKTYPALHSLFSLYTSFSICVCAYELVNVSIKNINILSRITRALVIFLLTQG